MWAVDKSVSEKLDDTSDSSMAATNILNWIFDKTKVKVTELIEKITKLVNELFQPLVDEKATGDTYQFDEKVRASLRSPLWSSWLWLWVEPIRLNLNSTTQQKVTPFDL